jgi:iron complex outermembrane receptor protein
MFPKTIGRASAVFLAGLAAIGPAPVRAEDDDAGPNEILVTAERPQAPTIENAPVSRASIDAAAIRATVNAVNAEDALKYLPSLVVRKRHIGDTQAPLATRTSGLGASARSLIFVDGALLSALIGNNNTTASPRWSIVSPEEISRVDVLYGPYSAAYAGNSIGAVVNITTRLPDHLEATANAGVNVQTFDLYGTHRTLPAHQIGATIGSRIGRLAFFASYDHVDSESQPLTYATAQRPAATSAIGTPTLGGYDDLNRLGQPIKVLGATAFEHQRQDRAKLKAAFDVTPDIGVAYVGSLFLNRTDAGVQSFLSDQATGATVYAGNLNIGDYNYNVPASAFANGVYRTSQRHWSHNVSLTGDGSRFDWQVIGTLYHIDKDIQRIAGTAPPAGLAGGAGTITDLKGTGWKTLDAKGAWKSDAAGTHVVSFGLHGDWFRLASNRTNTTDWVGGGAGALNLQSRGRTRTYALWAQDAWHVVPRVTLTVGGRYESWKAYDGANFSLTPLIGPVVQPTLTAHRFSPKATVAWDVAPHWTARLSFGQASRFPTVGELYQIVTSPVPAVPNPDLRPERARSEELAVERHDDHGLVRLALFNEVIKDALISQTGTLPVTPVQVGSFVQNVDRTRARGAELAVQRTDLLPRFDVSGSVTYADAITSRDTAFPAAVGKLLPQVPHWKATLVTSWRPTDRLSLTAAMRYSSRNYGTLDNSDVVGNTYQGFYKYLVIDLRAQIKIDEHMELGLGIDNVNNDKYFLFHPFPQRSFVADARVSF